MATPVTGSPDALRPARQVGERSKWSLGGYRARSTRSCTIAANRRRSRDLLYGPWRSVVTIDRCRRLPGPTFARPGVTSPTCAAGWSKCLPTRLSAVSLLNELGATTMHVKSRTILVLVGA